MNTFSVLRDHASGTFSGVATSGAFLGVVRELMRAKDCETERPNCASRYAKKVMEKTVPTPPGGATNISRSHLGSNHKQICLSRARGPLRAPGSFGIASARPSMTMGLVDVS